jgi:tetratricopeptide (TPR) repeat protein
VELARKALELDPANTDAYVSLGWVKTYFEYDWPGAARAFQRALELNPSSSEAVHSYSHYLVIAGDIQAALDASRQAAELSPFDRRISAHQIWALYMARRFPEAAATAESVLQTDPGSINARTYALMVYDQLPDHRRLVEEASRLKNEAYLARGLALSGNHAGARQMLADRLAANSPNEPIRIALIYLALGDKPTALTWLERSFERRLYPLPDIAADARFDPLRSEPRFQEILRRLGLGSRAPL